MYKFIILSMFRFLNPLPLLVFARQAKLLKDPVWPDEQQNPLYFVRSPMGKKVSEVRIEMVFILLSMDGVKICFLCVQMKAFSDREASILIQWKPKSKNS